MRYTGPKNRIARREGIDLNLKTAGSKSQAQLLKKLNIPPGQHGTRGKRKSSEHSQQLREKQKLRYLYGVTETQMKNYFLSATKKKGNTASYLVEMLERRLDNIVYRLGFAPTRASARQLVSHKHVKVNGKIVGTASYQVRAQEEITFTKEATTKIPYIEKSLENKDFSPLEWLERQAVSGKVIGTPAIPETEQVINLRPIIEFYSR